MGCTVGEMTAVDAQSALGWWLGAGVDVLVDEAPRNWMKPAQATAPAVPAPETPTLPTDLAAFQAWLTGAELPSGPGARVPPAGDPAAGLMILADMPEAGDAAAGMLLGGEAGILFDRMLAAIQRDRASIYLASVSPTHFPTGRVAVPALEALTHIVRRHVALAAPKMLLLLGDAPSVALLGQPMARARGRLHKINHDGVTVTAVASFHPRFLLQRPAAKTEAWADLRLMLGGMSQ